MILDYVNSIKLVCYFINILFYPSVTDICSQQTNLWSWYSFYLLTTECESLIRRWYFIYTTTDVLRLSEAVLPDSRYTAEDKVSSFSWWHSWGCTTYLCSILLVKFIDIFNSTYCSTSIPEWIWSHFYTHPYTSDLPILQFELAVSLM